MRWYVRKKNDSLKEPKEINYINEGHDISNIILIIKESIEKFELEHKTENKYYACTTLLQYDLFCSSVRGKAFRRSYFGKGNGEIAYTHVKCNGTEIDLLHCSMTTGGSPTCDHTMEAGVSCSCE